MAEATTSDENARRSRRWLLRYPRAVPVAIFLLVIAITGISVLVIERAEEQRELSRMRETGQAVASALERRGATGSSYLRAGAALLTTTQEIDPATFRRFVDELRLDSDYRGSDGIGWAEAITPAQVPRFEKALEELGYSQARVRPAPTPERRLLVPVTFLQPVTERNLRAIGYDMYSEDVRRTAMDEAVRTVTPTASGRLILVQEGKSDMPGFIVYMPIFDGAGVGRSLRGFIYSPFNAQQFLDSALQLETHGNMGIRLYDGAVVPDRLMAEIAPAVSTGNTLIEDVTIANLAMLLVVESANDSSLSLVSMLTLLFGLSVASLLMLIARLMTQQAMEDQASLDWLEEQHSIRNTLTRELNHRVKNTLANVLSIVALTRRRATSLNEFADGLDGRIRALSATHDLLTQSDWGTTPIRDVLDAELAPYTQGGGASVVRNGPEVEIAPNDALSLGLAIHELATNAAKYGALSTPEGRVEVTWEATPVGLLNLTWQESGGPVVPEERKRGFGTELIEKIVAHELKHPVKLDFAPSGVICQISVPIREPSPFRMRARPKRR